MNLYHLKYFVTLAHLQHYGKAAKQLSITQPSLSHAMASLEQELDVKLFQKEGRNIKLTPLGRQYLYEVEKALDLLKHSEAHLRESNPNKGHIRIAYLRILGINYIPDLLTAFLKTIYDNQISFTLNTDSGLSTDLLDALKKGKYDIVFCSFIQEDPALSFTPIYKQEFVVITPKNHELAKHTSLRLDEIIDYPFIMFAKKSGLKYVIDHLFEQIHCYPTNIIYEIEDDEAIAGMVAHHFGIAIVPYTDMLSLMDLSIIPIRYPLWKRYIYMITLKNNLNIPVIENFYQFAKDYLHQL